MATVDRYLRFEMMGCEYIDVHYDSKIYRFKRLTKNEPFTFDEKWKNPNEYEDTKWVRYGAKTPNTAIEFLETLGVEYADVHADKTTDTVLVDSPFKSSSRLV